MIKKIQFYLLKIHVYSAQNDLGTKIGSVQPSKLRPTKPANIKILYKS